MTDKLFVKRSRTGTLTLIIDRVELVDVGLIARGSPDQHIVAVGFVARRHVSYESLPHLVNPRLALRHLESAQRELIVFLRRPGHHAYKIRHLHGHGNDVLSFQTPSLRAFAGTFRALLLLFHCCKSFWQGR